MSRDYDTPICCDESPPADLKHRDVPLKNSSLLQLALYALIESLFITAKPYNITLSNSSTAPQLKSHNSISHILPKLIDGFLSDILSS